MKANSKEHTVTGVLEWDGNLAFRPSWRPQLTHGSGKRAWLETLDGACNQSMLLMALRGYIAEAEKAGDDVPEYLRAVRDAATRGDGHGVVTARDDCPSGTDRRKEALRSLATALVFVDIGAHEIPARLLVEILPELPNYSDFDAETNFVRMVYSQESLGLDEYEMPSRVLAPQAWLIRGALYEGRAALQTRRAKNNWRLLNAN